MELDVQRALYQRDDSTCSSLEYEDMKRSSRPAVQAYTFLSPLR